MKQLTFSMKSLGDFEPLFKAGLWCKCSIPPTSSSFNFKPSPVPDRASQRAEWRDCTQNGGNSHLPEDCRADWHFDFFPPASLMLMIWLWMGDLHRVWAIWVQFPSWGWKHIDCPLMVFMVAGREGHCFHPDSDIIEQCLPLMQSWCCVTI